MFVTALYRYPVKSMLGERVEAVGVTSTGVAGDRCLALVDAETGLVATAKHPRLWRDLLRFDAILDGDRVRITGPGGWTLDATDPGIEPALSDSLGRRVHLASQRPAGAEVERSDPEEVLAHGVEAELAVPTLEIGQGSEGTTFVDHSPVHLITTATLEHLGTSEVRYRPNVVVATGPDVEPYAENSWVGREVHLDDGDTRVVLRVALPTPRCSVPTLAHGDLPRAPHAVRRLMTENRVEVPGFGSLPCAGGYAQVVRGGTLHAGAEVTVH